MSALSPSPEASINQSLRATKKILQDVVFGVKCVRGGEDPGVRTEIRARRTSVAPDQAGFDVLEHDAIEILDLIRSWRNAIAPINRLPPEILVLLPDFWDAHRTDRNIIALTHVCRTWRQVFTSQPSLWTNLHCRDVDKTLVYLERSKSLPISLSLRRDDDLSPHDPFFQITPHAIGRLKSLFVQGTPESLHDITASLSCPAPLLEDMSIIRSRGFRAEDIPDLTPALFGGDLSSLHKLRLELVRTELPWRDMANLTSLMLINTSPVSMRQLLDFFESAPHLHEVELHFQTPTSDAEDGRLVSLAHLSTMSIDGGPSSVLLDHLLIPVGARLIVEVDLPKPPTEDHPRFLDNLRNLPGFTTIQLNGGRYPRMDFSGPNGEVVMELTTETTQDDGNQLALGALALFNTSEVEQLEVDFISHPSSYPPYHTLLSMKDLRVLKLHRCASPDIFIHALDPSRGSSGVVVCPKLEELAIRNGAKLNIKNVIGMVVARESRGARLNFVRVFTGWGGPACAQSDILELEKHVSHLEWRQGRW